MLMFLLIIAALYVLAIIILRIDDPELHWDWSHIDTSELHFPSAFLWGTATAAHQVEGGCRNNWSEWENSLVNGKSPIANGDKSGNACEHWERYPDDIKLMQELGTKAYRFSIEWSKVEPEEGAFDEDVLKHYGKMIDDLLAAGIEPMITLYHFTQPIWFAQKGGFEQPENIDYFQRYCERVFNEYSDRVVIWCTINEIEVEVTQSYFLGEWPPGKKDSRLVGVVMANLLEAHVRVYQALKTQPYGDQAQIGIVKNIFQFDPWRTWHLLDNLAGWLLNRVFNNAIIEFFTTGRFRLFIPALINQSHVNLKAPQSNDFVGLNYYSHLPVKFRWSTTDFFRFNLHPNEIPTDMDYTIYPEGLFRAVQTISRLKLPIYITENGIADAQDDRRELYIRRYLWALSQALRKGADVRGYFYWSLLDNFEWSEGWTMRFGLYEVNHPDQTRRLRDGAGAYQEIVSASGDTK